MNTIYSPWMPWNCGGSPVKFSRLILNKPYDPLNSYVNVKLGENWKWYAEDFHFTPDDWSIIEFDDYVDACRAVDKALSADQSNILCSVPSGLESRIAQRILSIENHDLQKKILEFYRSYDANMLKTFDYVITSIQHGHGGCVSTRFYNGKDNHLYEGIINIDNEKIEINIKNSGTKKL